MSRGLSERFEAKVDRSGAHHIWVGSKKADGSGKLKVDGRTVTAHRVAWELAHGPLVSGVEVRACPDERACVRIEHLSVRGEPTAATARPRRSPRGGGSKKEVRPGVWKLTVTAGRYADGAVRRLHRTVHASSETAATRELAAFVAEVQTGPLPDRRQDREVRVDDAIEQFLTEHLLGEKGREPRTVEDYRRLHVKWFSPEVGNRRVRDVDEAAIDRIFGRMRRAGLSRSRMNHAKSLYSPFFRWAKRRRLIARSPMADFELPTSTYVSREHTPPEVDQLCLLLETAVEAVPDIAPVLALGAVTGMRRGELVTVRRSRLHPEERLLTVDAATDGKRVKTTKTRQERKVAVDSETMAMLLRHCAQMDERAELCGLEIAPNAFVFSLALDCSTPMPPDHVTKRVALLKEHLGIANKRPETIALEDEALRLYRQPRTARPASKVGRSPAGGMSYAAIGEQLGRSERWATLAVASAQRREPARLPGGPSAAIFDGSIVALRKFTSSELLDAGFNISMVAQRQGHGPQVLVKHYAKARRSADRKAAEHLGRVVHRR
jgi:integrase